MSNPRLPNPANNEIEGIEFPCISLGKTKV